MEKELIVAKTPLRISLFGGSTDHPFFIQKYGHGSVISFTCNLKTYTFLNKDIFGSNTKDHKYIINYSSREEVNDIDQIKNDIVRLVAEYFNIEPVMISLTSDIFSNGSGLASSSSYLISLIKAISIFKNINMTDSEICSLAYDLELKINPYCGLQDPYGCGIGGFKKLDFYNKNKVVVEFLPTEIFDLYDMHLVFTGVTRNSKDILNDISGNIDKCVPLLEIVNNAYLSLINKNYDSMFLYFNEAWNEKKKTSKLITENSIIKKIDNQLSSNNKILAHKLCGAGNGGFFLCFSEKNSLKNDNFGVKISLSSDGIGGYEI